MTSSFFSTRPAHPWAYVTRFDPRARIVVAVAFSLIAAEVRSFAALSIALAAAVLGVAISGLAAATLLKRLLPLNGFVLLLAAILPLSLPGKTLIQAGPFCFSQDGLQLVAKIALKANAIVLAVIALIGTMELSTLGHALSHLRVPARLSHLLLFTVRYFEVIHGEYLRLRWAMKVRGFRPHMDCHTYRSMANLLGMLLVRAYDRSERISAAMKCRGFQGRFYLLDHFHFHTRDLCFSLASVSIMIAMLAAEFT